MNETEPPSRVVEWENDGVTYLASLPRGPIIALEDTALLIWRALGTGDIDDTAARVAQMVGADIEVVRTDVDAFVENLRREGLIATD